VLLLAARFFCFCMTMDRISRLGFTLESLVHGF
jgi:hypothetical protein